MNGEEHEYSLDQIEFAMRACKLLLECEEAMRRTGRLTPDPVLYSEAVRWARMAVGSSAD